MLNENNNVVKIVAISKKVSMVSCTLLTFKGLNKKSTQNGVLFWPSNVKELLLGLVLSSEKSTYIFLKHTLNTTLVVASTFLMESSSLKNQIFMYILIRF